MEQWFIVPTVRKQTLVLPAEAGQWLRKLRVVGNVISFIEMLSLKETSCKIRVLQEVSAVEVI